MSIDSVRGAVRAARGPDLTDVVLHAQDMVAHAGLAASAAAAAQQRTQHRNDAIRHAGAQKITAGKAAAHRQQGIDLNALYQRDNRQFQTDIRDKNFAAAKTMITAMAAIKQTLEIRAGISKAQASGDARALSASMALTVSAAMTRASKTATPDMATYWKKQFGIDKKAGNTTGEIADLNKYYSADLANLKAKYPHDIAGALRQALQDKDILGGTLTNGLKKLTAGPIGTGFHKSVYGYTSRQQVGQGVGLGETLVTFGGRVGKDPAQQMIQKLETQVQQLTQQNAGLLALLGAVEDGTAATVRVGDKLDRLGRPTPGSGIGNPLRVQGLATAIR